MPSPGRGYGFDVSFPVLDPSVGALDYWEPPLAWTKKENLPYFTPDAFADVIRLTAAKSILPQYFRPKDAPFSGATFDMTGVPEKILLELLDGLPAVKK